MDEVYAQLLSLGYDGDAIERVLATNTATAPLSLNAAIDL